MAASGVPLEEAGWEHPGRPGPWRDVWRRFRRHRMALVGLGVVGLVAVAAVAAPLLLRLGALPDPNALSTGPGSAPPGPGHLLGTDRLGRDLLARTLYGARISLSIGVLLQVVVLAIGGTIGMLAGYVGRWVDNLLMRVTDAVYAFPNLVFVLVMAAVLGPGYWNILIAAGVAGWPFLARLVRAQVLWVKEREYVEAARAAGGGPARIALRHVVPNAMGPVIVTLAFGVPGAIFIEAFLSFIGLGVRPPTPSLGTMLNEGLQAVLAAPHEALVPAVTISAITLAFNFIGDGLRDAVDPRMRR